MQHFLASLFALLFSFNHTPPAHTLAALPPLDPALTSISASHEFVPSRHQLAEDLYRSSYAESTCLSCRIANANLNMTRLTSPER